MSCRFQFMKNIIVYLSVIFLPHLGFSSLECHSLFLPVDKSSNYEEAASKAFYQIPSHDLIGLAREVSIHESHPLHDLAKKLFVENIGVLLGTEIVSNFKILKIEKVQDHPFFPVFRAQIHLDYNPDYGGPGIKSLVFRTNGHSAFLNNTFYHHQKKPLTKDFKAVYIADTSKIVPISQTISILLTLPQFIHVSRVMDLNEAQLWAQGKYSEISTANEHHGIHFALNHYDFPNGAKNPIIFKTQIPRSVLLDLAKKNLLTVNTYSSSVYDPKFGMTENARAPFGIEIEIVVLENEGRAAISNYMSLPQN